MVIRKTLVALLAGLVLTAHASDNHVRPAGVLSPHRFEPEAVAAQLDNEANLACITAGGISYFASWSTAFVLPTPYDFPPSFSAYVVNALLKFCPPEMAVPPAHSIDPESACAVDLAVDRSALPRMDYVFWVPTRSATDWGDLGKVRGNHMNSEVEIGLVSHTGQDIAGGISFPVGRHQIVWRGHTTISALDKVFIYVPGIPGGTRWAKAISLITEVGVEAGLIGAGLSIDGERHGVFHDETQFLNVLDLVPPQISVTQPSITLEANAFGGATRYFYRDVIDDLVIASDACDRPVALSYSHSYFPVDEITNLLITATDLGPNGLGESNSSAIFLQVEVVDTVPPVLRIPDNRVVESAGSAAVVLGEADVFDFVDDEPTVSHDALSLPGVSDLGGGEFEFPQGLTEVTWTAMDASGNLDAGIQTVNVKELGTNQAPFAFGQTVNTLTEEITEILIEADDPDADPLNFRITREPDHGSLISPLLPFFIEDYRQPVGAAPPGETYRCQPGRPADELAWPHALSVTEDGFTYVLDVGSVLPTPNELFTTCESFVFNRWPGYRLHKLAPDGTHLLSIDLPELGGYYFGGTLSIDEEAGTLIYATDVSGVPDEFLVIGLDDLSILEEIPLSIDYNGAWKGILTRDDILVHMAGTDELYFHDLRETRAVSPENEVATLQPFPPGEFHTDIVFDSEGNLYVKSEGPLYKYAPYSFDEDGNFVPPALIGWMGACNAGPGCDVANGRSRGFSCTNATCTWESTFGDVDRNIPGRSLGVSLAIDPLNNLYVGGHNIQRFTNTGLFAGIAYPDCPTEQRCFVLGDFGGAFSLFLNEHHLYSVDPDFELVHVFQTSVITPVDENTASIKYLSSWGFNDVDTIKFAADDGLDESAPGLVTINVSRQFRPPVAYRDRRQTVVEDTPTALLLDGYDPDGPIDTLTFDVLGQPLSGVVLQQGDDWVYTPDPDFSGQDQVLFRVFDGLDYSEPELFLIEVQPVNDAPVVEIEPLPEAGRGYAVQLAATFTDADPIDRHTVVVNWGDGVVENEGEVTSDGSMTGPILSEGNGQSGRVMMRHAYASTGVFPIEVCIVDNIVLVGEMKQPSATSLQSCTTDGITVSPMVDIAPVTDLLDPITETPTLTYRVEARNRAPESGTALGASGVTLDHTIEQASILAVTAAVGGSEPGSCSHSATEINCTAAAVGADQAFVVEIEIEPDPGIGEGDQMDFTTAVSADQDDPNPENTLIETVSIVPAADYLITERRDLPDATIDGVCATAATGRCSLRAAQDEINAEVGPHRSIQLGDGNYVLTYDDGSQKRGLFFGGSVVLNGISPDRTSLYAGGGDEAIQGSFASIELRNLTIEGGEDRAPIFVDFSTLLLDNVVLKGNVTNFGVVNVLQTNTEIRNSTFVDNRVTDAGGLITVDGESLELVNVSIVGNDSAGPLVLQTSEFNPVTTSLNHVTISGNSAPSLLGVASGNLQLGNSILSDNSDAAVSDCSGSGSVTSLGGNVVGVDLGCFVPLAEDTVTDAPLLGPVSTWGPGHSGRMPLEGSPALDQALTATCVSPDQIGQTRPRDGDMSGTLECDSGALELLLDWLFGDGFE